MATLLESKDASSKPKKSLSQKEKQDAKTQRNTRQKEIENLDKQLRALYFDICAMKKKWITPQECPEDEKRFDQNQALYVQIAEQKRIQRDLFEKIGVTKQALSKEKSTASSLRHEATDYQINASSPIEKKLLISKENYKCIENVESISINEEFVQYAEVSFSGTDNGFCTMTETSKVSREIFEFSLDLYNKCSVLEQEIDPSEFQEFDYLILPKAFKIYFKDIDHGRGQKKI
ncbi:hypothetical protein MFLAVUS_002629 [Mucor flavus]|uniref:Uncharacterized protein n=1 Tax=Mucor flavus TaxID=439312 RepID=A0ABP9YQT2_9FUNG